MKAHEIITNIILKKLEEGVIPWQKPWNVQAGIPKNLITRKEYQGINVFLLACQQYSSPWWLTFKQCKDLGGSIRKGAQGTPVIYWNWPETKEDGEKERKVPFMRYYTAFNVAQCEGIPKDKIPGTAETANNDINTIARCENIIEDWKDRPEITHGKRQASYSPSSDCVNMPEMDAFRNSEEYYSTLFHELTHSTGHEKRLNRQGISETTPFGTPLYSKEELVAEMGAAFLCGVAEIDCATIDNSAAYIQGWLEKLRNDKRLVIIAAAQAQKAAHYILNLPTS